MADRGEERQAEGQFAARRQPRERSREGPRRGVEPEAQRVREEYLEPTPGARELRPDPFPARILWGLLAGVVLGGLVGWILGSLLQGLTLVVPGWELLYSMGPFTFRFFWTMMGVAAGILLVGVGTMLATPPPDREAR